MSLRKKDDWDEALEEAGNKVAPAFVPGPDYDYGVTVRLSRVPKKNKTRKVVDTRKPVG